MPGKRDAKCLPGKLRSIIIARETRRAEDANWFVIEFSSARSGKKEDSLLPLTRIRKLLTIITLTLISV